ncbi:MAG: hypothetical protein Q9222_005665 [Ikaeria aurantiellina]
MASEAMISKRIYRVGTKHPKDGTYYQETFMDGSIVNIPGVKEAKRRKDMYQPFFSRAAIQKLEPVLQTRMQKFLSILTSAAKSKQVIDLSMAFRALTADMITQYCWQEPLGALDVPGFEHPFMMAIDEFCKNGRWDKYFPRTFILVDKILQKLPDSWVRRLVPPVKSIHDLQSDLHRRVTELKARSGKEADGPPTVFDTCLQPDLEKDQPILSDKDFVGDACLMLAAGMDTTAHALTTGTWHILSNPDVREKLQQELTEAIPDKATLMSASDVEELPYLTVISHSAIVYHLDENIFSDPHSFKPERWLDPDTFRELDRHLLSFSRGTRGCLGINLALSELNIVFAHLFRRLDLKVVGTTAGDMEWQDLYIPIIKGDLKVSITEMTK